MTPAGDVARGGLRVLLVIVAILASTSAGCSESHGRRVSARVIRVSDGDTLVARLATARQGEEKVRLVGIDCPESAQRWGPPAAARLATLVLGRPAASGAGPVAARRIPLTPGAVIGRRADSDAVRPCGRRWRSHNMDTDLMETEDAVCRICDRPILPGESVVKVAHDVMHAACLPSTKRRAEEHRTAS